MKNGTLQKKTDNDQEKKNDLTLHFLSPPRLWGIL